MTSLFGYHAIYARQQAQLRVIQAQIADAQADQVVQGEAASLVRRLEAFRKRLAPEPDPSWLVREAMTLMDGSGLQLITVTQESPRAAGLSGFTRVSIALQCRGTYHQFGQFIDRLERAGVFLKIDAIDVLPPADRDTLATAHLVISSLHVPPVAGTGAR